MPENAHISRSSSSNTLICNRCDTATPDPHTFVSHHSCKYVLAGLRPIIAPRKRSRWSTQQDQDQNRTSHPAWGIWKVPDVGRWPSWVREISGLTPPLSPQHGAKDATARRVGGTSVLMSGARLEVLHCPSGKVGDRLPSSHVRLPSAATKPLQVTADVRPRREPGALPVVFHSERLYTYQVSDTCILMSSFSMIQGSSSASVSVPIPGLSLSSISQHSHSFPRSLSQPDSETLISQSRNSSSLKASSPLSLNATSRSASLPFPPIISSSLCT
jgi:hypothetical protein